MGHVHRIADRRIAAISIGAPDRHRGDDRAHRRDRALSEHHGPVARPARPDHLRGRRHPGKQARKNKALTAAALPIGSRTTLVNSRPGTR
jgi:hypothetical protein